MSYILQGMAALIVFLGISSPIIVVGVIYYLKKRLEHKQIMTALEKGTPLSEIMPPKPKPAGPAWIKYVTSGIMLLIIGLGFTLGGIAEGPGIMIFFVLSGVGAGLLIRGLLHRKYYLKNQTSAENNSTEKKTSA
jgi:hypothetical protein